MKFAARSGIVSRSHVESIFTRTPSQSQGRRRERRAVVRRGADSGRERARFRAAQRRWRKSRCSFVSRESRSLDANSRRRVSPGLYHGMQEHPASRQLTDCLQYRTQDVETRETSSFERTRETKDRFVSLSLFFLHIYSLVITVGLSFSGTSEDS